MKLKDIGEAANNDQLLSILIVAVKRLAHTIIASPQAYTAQLVAWAKRARFTYKDDRTSYYAGLILESALNESAALRDAIAAAKAAGGAELDVSDEVLSTLVLTAIQRFAAQDI